MFHAEACMLSLMVVKRKSKPFLGGPQTCPECRRECANKRTLANHRQAAHGVPSQNSIYKQKIAAKQAARELAITPKEEYVVHEKVQGPGNIDPIIFVLTETVGQVKELCRHIAEEHGVPRREFTRQFAEIFRDQTRR